MESSEKLDGIAKAIRRLTVAVWFLVAIGFIQMAAWLVPFVTSTFYMKVAGTSVGIPKEAFESWEGLSFEDKVKRASIILVTENRHESGKIRAFIKEELKRAPGTAFHYSVGDEYLPLAVVPRENTNYGDGALVFLQGSPATNRESYAIYNGSISALGEMPLPKVRQIIAQSK